MMTRLDSVSFISVRVDAHLAKGPVSCRSLCSDAHLAKRSSRIRRHSVAPRSRSAHNIKERFMAQRRESHPQSAINCAATTQCCPLLVQLKHQPAADWFPDSDGTDALSDRPNAAPGSAPSRCLHGCPSMRSSGYDVESTASAPAPSPHQ